MKKSTPDLLDRKGLQTAAVDLLSRRDYSRQELWRKLSPKAESSESLESVLSDLSERQWQSDERFASMFVRSRSSRGVGPRRLSQELRHKGVSEDITGHAIEEAEIDWYSQALEAAEKKLRHIKGDQYAQQARLYRFLTYRGFSSEIISKVSQTLLPELAK